MVCYGVLWCVCGAVWCCVVVCAPLLEPWRRPWAQGRAEMAGRASLRWALSLWRRESSGQVPVLEITLGVLQPQL